MVCHNVILKSEIYVLSLPCMFDQAEVHMIRHSTGITKEGLVAGLRNCIHASPAFAPLALDLLLDKLASSISDTKVCC